jgi:hypothetical protein
MAFFAMNVRPMADGRECWADPPDAPGDRTSRPALGDPKDLLRKPDEE